MSIRSVSWSQLRKILHTTDSFPFTLWLLNIRFSLIQPCCLKWFERVQEHGFESFVLTEGQFVSACTNRSRDVQSIKEGTWHRVHLLADCTL